MSVVSLKVVSRSGSTQFYTENIDSVDAAMRRVYKKLHALKQLGEKVIFAHCGDETYQICFSIDSNGRYRKIPFCWAQWMFEKFIGKKIIRGVGSYSGYLPNDNLEDMVDNLVQAMVA